MTSIKFMKPAIKSAKFIAIAIFSSGLACTVIPTCRAIAEEAAAASSSASKADGQALPSLAYDHEKEKVSTLQYRNLRIVVDTVPDTDPHPAPDDESRSRIRGYYAHRLVFSFVMGSAQHPKAKLRFIQIDPKARLPQLVVTTFSGGAHCCTRTKIVTVDARDHWHVLDPGMMDGDYGFQFLDLDHDGGRALVATNQRFLYAFGCYACSYAPTTIWKLKGARFKDAAKDPKYRPLLRAELKRMEENADWHSNGFLGGWVAQKSLLGEVDEAWKKMLASYDRESDWDYGCEPYGPWRDCSDSKSHKLSFPEAVLQHLKDGGYALPADPDIPR